MVFHLISEQYVPFLEQETHVAFLIMIGKLKNGTRISGWSVFGKEADGYSWTHVTAPDINGVEIWGWVVDDYLTGVEPKNNQINSFSADVG